MASITTILGTDSLASSRIVINDNFASVNDEVEDIAGLLDVSNQTLTITGNINAAGATLASGGSNLLVVNTSNIIASLPVILEDSVEVGGGLTHAISAVSAMPAANSYTKSTYVLDGAVLTGVNTIADGDAGQTVTFIADGDVTLDQNDIAGATTNVTVLNNGSITLRFYNNDWYVISYANATVNF